MEPIKGHFKVRWVSGLLPPFGLSKRFDGTGRGVTTILKLPLMPFRLVGKEIRYFAIPLRDTLEPSGNGSYLGEGYFLGVRFCRFRLDPV